jgi:hypothetical protein
MIPRVELDVRTIIFGEGKSVAAGPGGHADGVGAVS